MKTFVFHLFFICFSFPNFFFPICYSYRLSFWFGFCLFFLIQKIFKSKFKAGARFLFVMFFGDSLTACISMIEIRAYVEITSKRFQNLLKRIFKVQKGKYHSFHFSRKNCKSFFKPCQTRFLTRLGFRGWYSFDNLMFRPYSIYSVAASDEDTSDECRK